MNHSDGVRRDPARPATSTGVRPLRRRGAIAAAMLLMLRLPAAAPAAGRPAAATGAASDVSFSSATVGGSINPNASNTSYYFQYGPTRAYGGQSAIADAGGGARAVRVRVALAGLQPLTVYHYRLVAVNATGATVGGDATFLTSKVPLSLGLLASPNPVLFGGTAIVQGTLAGTENANRTVVLQAFLFGATGFQNFGNPELTNAFGSFSFPILNMTQVTQFRVVTTTKPAVISPVVVENVAVRVSSHVARTRRRGFVRISGGVTPAANGMQVGILRIVHGHGVLVGGTILRHLNASSSQYSRVVHVRPGVYRVLVRVVGGAQVSNYGPPLVFR
jgi:hypothetical protein